ncbi:hypothetical protein GVAV_000141 [Gurleya vavrai]
MFCENILFIGPIKDIPEKNLEDLLLDVKIIKLSFHSETALKTAFSSINIKAIAKSFESMDIKEFINCYIKTEKKTSIFIELHKSACFFNQLNLDLTAIEINKKYNHIMLHFFIEFFVKIYDNIINEPILLMKTSNELISKFEIYDKDILLYIVANNFLKDNKLYNIYHVNCDLSLRFIENSFVLLSKYMLEFAKIYLRENYKEIISKFLKYKFQIYKYKVLHKEEVKISVLFDKLLYFKNNEDGTLNRYGFRNCKFFKIELTHSDMIFKHLKLYSTHINTNFINKNDLMDIIYVENSSLHEILYKIYFYQLPDITSISGEFFVLHADKLLEFFNLHFLNFDYLLSKTNELIRTYNDEIKELKSNKKNNKFLDVKSLLIENDLIKTYKDKIAKLNSNILKELFLDIESIPKTDHLIKTHYDEIDESDSLKITEKILNVKLLPILHSDLHKYDVFFEKIACMNTTLFNDQTKLSFKFFTFSLHWLSTHFNIMCFQLFQSNKIISFELYKDDNDNRIFSNCIPDNKNINRIFFQDYFNDKHLLLMQCVAYFNYIAIILERLYKLNSEKNLNFQNNAIKNMVVDKYLRKSKFCEIFTLNEEQFDGLNHLNVELLKKYIPIIFLNKCWFDEQNKVQRIN